MHPKSPNIFSDEEQDSDSPAIKICDKNKENLRLGEEKLLKNMTLMLKGIPPPPSLAICRLSCAKMLESYHLNIHLNAFPHCSNPLVDVNPKVYYLNSSHVSEEIGDISMKFQTRYVQSETASSYTFCAESDRKESNSARKRRLHLAGVSPGRRLSHLARRRQIFSRVNLQQLAENEHKNQLLAIKTTSRLPGGPSRNVAKEFIDKKQVMGASSSRNFPKRALFQSPEEVPVRAGYRTVQRHLPRRRLFPSGAEPVDVLPAGGGSYDVSSWLASQPFAGGRKRDREDESHDRERKRKCPRRSLDFSDGDASSQNSGQSGMAAPAPAAEPREHLSSVHRKKLLWSVSTALKELGITSKEESFKPCASELFQLCKKNLTSILGSFSGGSSSMKMVTYAREQVRGVVDRLGFKPLIEPVKLTDPAAALCDITTTLNQQDRQSRLNSGKESAEKTPKKKIRRRGWRTCLKSSKKSSTLTRSRSLENIVGLLPSRGRQCRLDKAVHLAVKRKRELSIEEHVSTKSHGKSHLLLKSASKAVQRKLIEETPEKYGSGSEKGTPHHNDSPQKAVDNKDSLVELVPASQDEPDCCPARRQPRKRSPDLFAGSACSLFAGFSPQVDKDVEDEENYKQKCLKQQNVDNILARDCVKKTASSFIGFSPIAHEAGEGNNYKQRCSKQQYVDNISARDCVKNTDSSFAGFSPQANEDEENYKQQTSEQQDVANISARCCIEKAALPFVGFSPEAHEDEENYKQQCLKQQYVDNISARYTASSFIGFSPVANDADDYNQHRLKRKNVANIFARDCIEKAAAPFVGFSPEAHRDEENYKQHGSKQHHVDNISTRDCIETSSADNTYDVCENSVDDNVNDVSVGIPYCDITRLRISDFLCTEPAALFENVNKTNFSLCEPVNKIDSDELMSGVDVVDGIRNQGSDLVTSFAPEENDYDVVDGGKYLRSHDLKPLASAEESCDEVDGIGNLRSGHVLPLTPEENNCDAVDGVKYLRCHDSMPLVSAEESCDEVDGIRNLRSVHVLPLAPGENNYDVADGVKYLSCDDLVQLAPEEDTCDVVDDIKNPVKISHTMLQLEFPPETRVVENNVDCETEKGFISEDVADSAVEHFVSNCEYDVQYVASTAELHDLQNSKTFASKCDVGNSEKIQSVCENKNKNNFSTPCNFDKLAEMPLVSLYNDQNDLSNSCDVENLHERLSVPGSENENGAKFSNLCDNNQEKLHSVSMRENQKEINLSSLSENLKKEQSASVYKNQSEIYYSSPCNVENFEEVQRVALSAIGIETDNGIPFAGNEVEIEAMDGRLSTAFNPVHSQGEINASFHSPHNSPAANAVSPEFTAPEDVLPLNHVNRKDNLHIYEENHSNTENYESFDQTADSDLVCKEKNCDISIIEFHGDETARNVSAMEKFIDYDVDVTGTDSSDEEGKMCTSTPLVALTKKLVKRSSWKIEPGPGLKLRVRLLKEWEIQGQSAATNSVNTSSETSANLTESTSEPAPKRLKESVTFARPCIDLDSDAPQLSTLIDNSVIRRLSKAESSATSMESYTLTELRDRLAIERTLAHDDSELSFYEADTSGETESEASCSQILYNRSDNARDASMSLGTNCADAAAGNAIISPDVTIMCYKKEEKPENSVRCTAYRSYDSEDEISLLELMSEHSNSVQKCEKFLRKSSGNLINSPMSRVENCAIFSANANLPSAAKRKTPRRTKRLNNGKSSSIRKNNESLDDDLPLAALKTIAKTSPIKSSKKSTCKKAKKKLNLEPLLNSQHLVKCKTDSEDELPLSQISKTDSRYCADEMKDHVEIAAYGNDSNSKSSHHRRRKQPTAQSNKKKSVMKEQCVEDAILSDAPVRYFRDISAHATLNDQGDRNSGRDSLSDNNSPYRVKVEQCVAGLGDPHTLSSPTWKSCQVPDRQNPQAEKSLSDRFDALLAECKSESLQKVPGSAFCYSDNSTVYMASGSSGVSLKNETPHFATSEVRDDKTFCVAPFDSAVQLNDSNENDGDSQQQTAIEKRDAISTTFDNVPCSQLETPSRLGSTLNSEITPGDTDAVGSDASLDKSYKKLSLEAYKARKKLDMTDTPQSTKVTKVRYIRLKKAKSPRRRKTTEHRSRRNSEYEDYDGSFSQPLPNNLEYRSREVENNTQTIVNALSTISCVVEQQIKVTMSTVADGTQCRQKINKLKSIYAKNSEIMKVFQSGFCDPILR